MYYTFCVSLFRYFLWKFQPAQLFLSSPGEVSSCACRRTGTELIIINNHVHIEKYGDGDENLGGATEEHEDNHEEEEKVENQLSHLQLSNSNANHKQA